MPPVGSLGSIAIVQALMKYLDKRGEPQPNGVTEGASYPGTPFCHPSPQLCDPHQGSVYDCDDAAQLKGLVEEVVEVWKPDA